MSILERLMEAQKRLEDSRMQVAVPDEATRLLIQEALDQEPWGHLVTVRINPAVDVGQVICYRQGVMLAPPITKETQ